MIELRAGPAFTEAKGDTWSLKAVHRALAILSPHRHASKAFREGAWDGVWRMVDERNRFLTGLLPLLLRTLLAEDFEVRVTGAAGTLTEDETRRLASGDLTLLAEPLPYEVPDRVGGFELRDYQRKAVLKALASQRGVIEISTGGGKTVVAAAILHALGEKALFLVGSSKILAQSLASFRKIRGVTVGQVGGGKRQMRADIVVGTVQTMSRLAARGEDEGLTARPVLFYDEAHHAGATTWSALGALSEATYRYGLSATPFRGDGYDHLEDLTLTGLTGDPVVRIPSYLLRRWGYLAEPLVTFVPIRLCPGLRKIRYSKDWHLVYDVGVVQNTVRNHYATEIASHLFAQGHKVMLVVSRLDHGDLLLRALPEGTRFLTGADRTRVRTGEEIEERQENWDDVRADLEARRRWITVASPVIDEGVDIPSLSAIVILAGGKSGIKTIQRVGRGLRRKEGENVVLVFDFLDEYHRILQRHSYLRRDHYRKEKFPLAYDFERVNALLDAPLTFRDTDWLAIGRAGLPD